MTKEEAVKMYHSGWWESLTPQEIVSFQLYEPRLCMPFDKFHEAVAKSLGHPVFTHEFAYSEDMRREFEARHPKVVAQ